MRKKKKSKKEKKEKKKEGKRKKKKKEKKNLNEKSVPKSTVSLERRGSDLKVAYTAGKWLVVALHEAIEYLQHEWSC